MLDSPLGRLDAMYLILIWEGEIGRSRVTQLFGVGQTRASQWIKELRDQYPESMEWDTKARTFKAINRTYELFDHDCATTPARAASLSRYLALTGLPLDDPGQRADGIQWASYPDLSAPGPATFARLRQAILYEQVVDIQYSSMRNPEPHSRRISPHGLVKAGRRWHVRAFCERTGDFRDFSIGRISALSYHGIKAEHRVEEDEAWNAWVKIELIAHPDLSALQAKLIQREYFNGAERRLEACRGSLLHYLLQDLMVAVDVKTQRAPDYQLALANPKEVAPWLFQ